MGLSARSHRSEPRINVAPLVDIVLVLLIVFIALVPGLVRVAPVALPVRGGGVDGTPLVLILDRDGSWRLQQEPTRPGDLERALAGAVQRQPFGFRKVYLKVHPELPHQQVVAALDAIRRADALARQETRRNPRWSPADGGRIRVVTGLLVEG